MLPLSQTFGFLLAPSQSTWYYKGKSLESFFAFLCGVIVISVNWMSESQNSEIGLHKMLCILQCKIFWNAGKSLKKSLCADFFREDLLWFRIHCCCLLVCCIFHSFFSHDWKKVMRCAIWYHVHNLKNMKNTHGGVLLLVSLQLY